MTDCKDPFAVVRCRTTALSSRCVAPIVNPVVEDDIDPDSPSPPDVDGRDPTPTSDMNGVSARLRARSESRNHASAARGSVRGSPTAVARSPRTDTIASEDTAIPAAAATAPPLAVTTAVDVADEEWIGGRCGDPLAPLPLPRTPPAPFDPPPTLAVSTVMPRIVRTDAPSPGSTLAVSAMERETPRSSLDSPQSRL